MMARSLAGALLAFALLSLGACSGEPHGDLREFVKQSENLPHGRIAPLPEVKPYEPFTYSAFDLLDPFKPRKIEPPRGTSGGGIAPDLNRRREPLEGYPLESLRMVGTLEQKKQVYALVRAPDNTLFRVRTGNYVGQNFGRIVGISESAIKLKEIVQDGSGNWEEKDQVLQLQEEGSDAATKK
jgi:type IV pilus assembly protein PilP